MNRADHGATSTPATGDHPAGSRLTSPCWPTATSRMAASAASDPGSMASETPLSSTVPPSTDDTIASPPAAGVSRASKASTAIPPRIVTARSTRV